jgi:hypothetical protein
MSVSNPDNFEPKIFGSMCQGPDNFWAWTEVCVPIRTILEGMRRFCGGLLSGVTLFKISKHCWTGEAFSITALSYIQIQLFEHIISRHVRAVPHAMASLQISQFSHLPSTSLLCPLDESPTTLVGSQNLSC